MKGVAFEKARVSAVVLTALASGVGVLVAQGTTFTLKSSVSETDFDWSSGVSYVGDPATGPAAGDTIIIPNGVTAKASAAAITATGPVASATYTSRRAACSRSIRMPPRVRE